MEMPQRYTSAQPWGGKVMCIKFKVRIICESRGTPENITIFVAHSGRQNSKMAHNDPHLTTE